MSPLDAQLKLLTGLTGSAWGWNCHTHVTHMHSCAPPTVLQSNLVPTRPLLCRYNLVGLDINYEEGLDGPAGDSFAPAMAGLIERLKAWRPRLLVTIAPFDAVWGRYKQLLQVGD